MSHILAGLVFRLAFAPCLVETLVVAVASHLLLDFPWLWGFMLGFVLAAVSPAVVVPCLLQLQGMIPQSFHIWPISHGITGFPIRSATIFG